MNKPDWISEFDEKFLKTISDSCKSYDSIEMSCVMIKTREFVRTLLSAQKEEWIERVEKFFKTRISRKYLHDIQGYDRDFSDFIKLMKEM